MSDKTKDARVTFRLTDEEQQRLLQIASREGQKPSGLIREALRRFLRRKAA